VGKNPNGKFQMNPKRKPPMLRTRLFFKAQIIVLAMLLAGCGKKASDEIDFGTFNNSTYKNNYFGLSVTIPSDWSIQDQDAQRRLMKLGGKLISGDDKNLQAVLKASELQVVNLFGVFKYAQGSPVTFNPSILSLAENVHQLPGIKRGKDYHFHARKVLESGQMQISFPKDIYTQQLGGVDFDVMETEMSVRGMVIKQKYYATIMKGYALCFIQSFTTNEEEASLQKVLDTVTFK
jgi:hypothetical protein